MVCLVGSKQSRLIGLHVVVGLALIGLLAPGAARGGTATLIDGQVRYTAAPGEANRVQIIFVPGEGVHVIDRNNSVTPGTGCVSVNTDAAFCVRRLQQANLSLILVRLGDGNDRVRINAAARVVHLFGGAGADDLQGGGRRNVLDGGPGADILHAAPGYYHWDIVDYSSRTRRVRVTIGDGLANDGQRGEGDLVTAEFEEVRGGMGDDMLKGEPDRDRLKGGPGNDALWGGAGRDRLFGQSGGDVLRARDGHRDVVAGGRGFDRARIDVGLDLATSIGAFF